MENHHIVLKPYKYRLCIGIVIAICTFYLGTLLIQNTNATIVGFLFLGGGLIFTGTLVAELIFPMIISIDHQTIRWQRRNHVMEEFQIQDVTYIFFDKEGRGAHYDVTFRIQNENHGFTSRLQNFNDAVAYILELYENETIKHDVIHEESLKELYDFKKKFIDRNKNVPW